MIPNIPNRYARRTLLVLTVFGVVVVLGPLHMGRAVGRAVWTWVEREFDVDLRAVWK